MKSSRSMVNVGGSGVAPPDVDHGAAALHRVLGAAGAVREPAACPRPREKRRHHSQSQEGETSPPGGGPPGRAAAIPAALEAPRRRRDAPARPDRPPPPLRKTSHLDALRPL